MAQTGYTPIQLYYSATAAATPTSGNLANGELALNITDGKLFYKDNGGTVRTLATRASALAAVVNNTVAYVNSSGQLTSDSSLSYDGANLRVGGASSANMRLLVTHSADAPDGILISCTSSGTLADARLQLSNGVTSSGLIIRGTGRAPAGLTTLFANGGFSLTTNVGHERLRVENEGTVSIINTATVGGPLLVGYNAAVTGEQLGVQAANPLLDIRSDTASGTAALQLVGLNANGNSAAQTRIQAEPDTTSPNGASRLMFYTRSSTNVLTERMRIASDGSVGIGGANIAGIPLTVLDDGAAGSSVTLMRLQVPDLTSANTGVSLVMTAAGTDTRSAQLRAISEGSAAGNGHTLAFYTSPNNGSAVERMRISPAGDVGIGTSAAPTSKLQISGTIPIITLTDTSTGADCLLGGNNATGTLTLEADANNEVANSTIELNVDGTTRMLINSSGDIFSVNGGAIGYSTGSGGAVTQATSKTTGVTLNTVSGRVTMNAAALAAGASVVFALTNSKITAADVVIFQVAGGTASAYTVNTLNAAAGSVRVRVTNISAGSLSEAVPLNFVVIKAQTT